MNRGILFIVSHFNGTFLSHSLYFILNFEKTACKNINAIPFKA